LEVKEARVANAMLEIGRSTEPERRVAIWSVCVCGNKNKRGKTIKKREIGTREARGDLVRLCVWKQKQKGKNKTKREIGRCTEPERRVAIWSVCVCV